MTKRHAQEVLDALLKLEMISPCEFQHDKNMVSCETIIRGNALGMAKAGKPLKRSSAGNVLWELLGRVKAVNDRQDLAYTVEAVGLSLRIRPNSISCVDIHILLRNTYRVFQHSVKPARPKTTLRTAREPYRR
jgi:hypothetical protein